MIELIPFGTYYTWPNKKGKINARRYMASDGFSNKGVALTITTAQVQIIVVKDGEK